MMPRIRSVRRLFFGAPAALESAALVPAAEVAARGKVAGKRVGRVSLGVAALAALVGLAGCYGHHVLFISGQPVVNNALWVANGTSVLEFLPSQLTNGTSDPAPHFT